MKIIDGLHGFLWNSMTMNNCNTYLVDGPARILIDPGHLQAFANVETNLRQLGLAIDDIDLVISTHAHPDHIEAVRLFKAARSLFAMHEKDWEMVREMGPYLGASVNIESYIPDFYLKDGELKVKGLAFEVVHTPGHSPGSICIYWPDRKVLFSGDLIFKDGIGRTDLPGGDPESLKASVKKLAGLDVEWVLPGHGDIIAGRDQVQLNFERIEEFWFGLI